MTFFKRLLPTLALLALAACGGGSSSTSSTQPFGGTGSGTGTGGGTTTTASVADLILVVSSAQLPDTASSTVAITATAVDSGRVVIPGATVQLSADSDAVIAQATAVTDTNGKVTGSLSIGSNRANRVITVTASSGGLTKTATVQVVGASVASTLVPAVVAPGAAAQIQYRVTDQSGSPMAAQAAQVSAPGLAPADATGATDSNGAYVYSYTAPATAGTYTVMTTIGGVTDQQVVNVQSAASVGPASGVISSASVSANPSVVGVNPAGSTATNRSEIRALFVGAGNVPIQNVRVRFDLAGDPNAVGGTFSTGSATLYSDANGVVTSAYIPGARSSPTDGVTVRACYGMTDTDPNLLNCTNAKTTTLTVVSQPMGVSIGTNELVIVNTLTYQKQFLISVVDAAGNAMADVPLSVSLDLPRYRKGYYTLPVNGKSWVKAAADTVCANEDLNRNHVLDTGEDINGNSRLDPGVADVQVQLLSATTGPDGTAVAQVTYAKSFGTWVDAWLTVSASGVGGTEGRATYVLAPVPVDATSLTTTTSAPAYQISPYGIATDCTNPN